LRVSTIASAAGAGVGANAIRATDASAGEIMRAMSQDIDRALKSTARIENHLISGQCLQ
jgi:hypothetical protein